MTGPCAFSLNSLVAQRDAGIGDGCSGQPHRPAPGDLSRRRLRLGLPVGMAACRGSGPLDDPGTGAHLRIGIQVVDTDGIRIVPAGFPPLARCVATGDRFRRQDGGPYGTHLRTEAHASWQSGRPCRRHDRTVFRGRRGHRSGPPPPRLRGGDEEVHAIAAAHAVLRITVPLLQLVRCSSRIDRGRVPRAFP